MQFFTLGSLIVELSETYNLHIGTTQNDHPTYAKHVLGGICAFFGLFGYWVRICRDGYTTNLLMQFSTLGSSKMKVSATFSFDIATTRKDHLAYVKHALRGICVFFTLLG